MLKALQQTVKVGTGGKIELLAPECPEGAEVQVIVLISPNTQPLQPTLLQTSEMDSGQQQLTDPMAKVQAIVRKYVPEGHSLVDELITERRAEAKDE